MSRVDAEPAADPRAAAKSAVAIPAKAASLQYDLFTTFFGKPEDLSNTIELWDAIPKYSYRARRQVEHREEGRALAVYEHTFQWQPQPKRHNAPLRCKLTITPARVKDGSGWADVFPSTDEELVEEVLRKIFCDQQYGIHDRAAGKSYVRFSLHMIRKELAARRKTRSIAEIQRSLDVLSKAHVTVQVDTAGPKQVLCKGAILPVLLFRGEDGDSDLWAAQLHPLITAAVDRLTYRQFNYATLMSLASPLSRWMLKRLCHEYLNAGLMDPYRTLLTTIARDSGMLTHSRMSGKIATLERALEELVARGVLLTFKAIKRMDGNAIDDVEYVLTPSSHFVSETKAANARDNRNDERMLATGQDGPWKSRGARRQIGQPSGRAAG